MQLNPDVDLQINDSDLTSEFKNLSLTLYRYYVRKAEAEREFDNAKAIYEEVRAHLYKEIRGSGDKKTEKTIEAEIETNPDAGSALSHMLEAKQTLSTCIGAVESLKAKKDMLIQLGADARKEF